MSIFCRSLSELQKRSWSNAQQKKLNWVFFCFRYIGKVLWFWNNNWSFTGNKGSDVKVCYIDWCFREQKTLCKLNCYWWKCNANFWKFQEENFKLMQENVRMSRKILDKPGIFHVTKKNCIWSELFFKIGKIQLKSGRVRKFKNFKIKFKKISLALANFKTTFQKVWINLLTRKSWNKAKISFRSKKLSSEPGKLFKRNFLVFVRPWKFL